MVRNRQSVDMEVTDETSRIVPCRRFPHLCRDSGLVAVELRCRGWSQAGDQTDFSLRSVPDGLNIYVAAAGRSETLFNQDNFKGRTPLTLQVEAGDVSARLSRDEGALPAQLGAIEEIQPGVRTVSFYRDTALIQYPDKVVALAGGSREMAVQPDLAETGGDGAVCVGSLTRERQRPEEFNGFYYKIDGTDIAQVGAIYTVRVSQARNEHIGIILPSRYLRAGEHIEGLRSTYPQERRIQSGPPGE